MAETLASFNAQVPDPDVVWDIPIPGTRRIKRKFRRAPVCESRASAYSITYQR
jgi:hypothetical protein